MAKIRSKQHTRIPMILYSFFGILFSSRCNKFSFFSEVMVSSNLRFAMKLIGSAYLRSVSDYSSTFIDSSKGFSSTFLDSCSRE